MTKDDIIRMAREAGFERLGTYASFGEDWVAFTESLEAFAALVVAAEREACLNLAKENAAKYKRGGYFYPLMNIHTTRAAATACDHVAHLIRARGTT